VKSVAFLLLISICFGFLLIPAVIFLYRRLGKLDQPDGVRKFHTQPIPRAGGVAIFLSFAAALGFLQFLPAGGNLVIDRYSEFLSRLFPATAVMFLTGLLDDWIDLRPQHKLAGQVLASVLAYWAGIRILSLPSELAWLGFLLTIFWLVLSANAFNLIDGSDGLAGTLGLLSSLGLVVVAVAQDYMALALLFAPLAGAIVPFLRRNWPPADVFMGDAGSLTIGFLIGCGGAALSRRYPDGSGLLAAMLLLALPFAEVAVSIARRTLRGRSVFSADDQHLHHQLRRTGLSPKALLLHLSLFSTLAVALATCIFSLGAPERILLLGCLAILFLRELSALPYREFAVFSRGILRGGVLHWIRAQIELDQLAQNLQKASSCEDVWRELRLSAGVLGIPHLEGQLLGTYWNYSASANPHGHANHAVSFQRDSWQLRINLGRNSWVNIYGHGSRSGLHCHVTQFADTVQRSLSGPRLATLLREAGSSPALEEAVPSGRSG
jgi:UDP-GlcNAc:undecaprenyl-phosphate GlcNAc-1-phosphate transferase